MPTFAPTNIAPRWGADPLNSSSTNMTPRWGGEDSFSPSEVVSIEKIGSRWRIVRRSKLKNPL